MNDDLILALKKTTESLQAALSKFDDTSLNLIFEAGSWSGGQVVDHILKSQAGLPQMLGSGTRSTERNPEEKREGIKKLFLDFSTKMKSPESILPSAGPFAKDVLINLAQAQSDKIIEAFTSSDLSRECTARDFPGFGTLTGLEWAWFIIYHTQRHIHQLQKIAG